jgi:hypothetical protein
MDSYAYSERTDLGFSLFLDRRCKIIYFIDNAEAFHNLVEVGVRTVGWQCLDRPTNSFDVVNILGR